MLAQARAEGFRRPPARKWPGPVVDVHTHASLDRGAAGLLEAAGLYGVHKLFVIGSLDSLLPLRDRYPGQVEITPVFSFPEGEGPEEWVRRNRQIIAAARAAGALMVKLWAAPRFYARTRLWAHSPLLEPLWQELESSGLALQIHVADPDLWFTRVYTDRGLYGRKEEHLAQLEAILQRHPGLRVLAAHMGGHPEDLDALGRLLDLYPQLYLDTGATRWIVRELGRQRERSRQFLMRYAGRILFGTDQVTLADPEPARYEVRYWIHQMFWETALECDLPIDDTDAPGGRPRLYGLDLPATTLRQLYLEAACRFFGRRFDVERTVQAERAGQKDSA